MALGCTVVSTLIRSRLEGRTAPRVEPGLDRGRQQRLQSFWPEPFAPARQRARITGHLMLEVLAAAEPLFAEGLSSHDDAVASPGVSLEVLNWARRSRQT